MSGNGLIYASIVGAWAAYLIPMWLRRQDDSADDRPDRVSAAMRVLSRRPQPLPQQRYLLRPRSAPPVPVVKRTGPDRALAPGAPAATAGGRSAGAREVMARRRQVLGIFAALLSVTALGARLGLVPWLVVAGPLVLLTAYVAQLRALARRERAAGRRHAPAAPGKVVPVGRAAAPVRRRPARRSAPAGDRDSAGVRGERELPDHRPAARDEDGWAPVPVPLPTYVTAPKATRNVRTIDLGADGAWTSGRLEDGGTAGRPTVVPDPPPVAADIPVKSESRAEQAQPRAVND